MICKLFPSPSACLFFIIIVVCHSISIRKGDLKKIAQLRSGGSSSCEWSEAKESSEETRLRPRVWEDSTLLWELQQHPHGLSRQAACKEHEWDLCVSVKFSLLFGIWNRFSMHSEVQLFHHSSSWWIQQIAPSRKISEINIPSLGAVQHVCLTYEWDFTYSSLGFISRATWSPQASQKIRNVPSV